MMKSYKKYETYIVLLVLSLMFLFSMFYRYLMAVLTPELQRDFSLTSTTLGSLSAAYFYSYGLCQIPVGILADKFSADIVILWALGITTTGSFVFSTANTLPQLFLGRVLIGVGAGGLYTPALRKLAGCFKTEYLSTAIGVMNALGCVGAVLATVPMAMLIKAFSWRSILIAISFLLLMTGFFWIIIVAKSHLLNAVSDTGISETNTKPREDAFVEPSSFGRVELIKRIAHSINSRYMWVLGFSMLSLNGVAVAFQGLWGPSFLMQVGGLSEAEAERTLMSLSFGTVLGGPLFGVLSDKADTRCFQMLALGLAVYLSVWLFVLSPILLSLPVWIVLSFIMGILASGMVVHIFSTCERITYDTTATTTLAAVNTMGFLGASLFQPTIGFIVEQASAKWGIGAPLGYRLAFSVVLISLVVSLWLVRSVMNNEKPMASG